MVYAVNDLKTGDEIMWNYVDLNCPYKKRVERLQHYRFTCNCQLCELDRTDPHYEEREELLQNIPQLKTKIAENPKKTLPDVISLVNQVKQTFKYVIYHSLCFKKIIFLSKKQFLTNYLIFAKNANFLRNFRLWGMPPSPLDLPLRATPCSQIRGGVSGVVHLLPKAILS